MFTIGADEALRTHPQTQNATIYIDIACIQETHKDRTDTQANGEREKDLSGDCNAQTYTNTNDKYRTSDKKETAIYLAAQSP